MCLRMEELCSKACGTAGLVVRVAGRTEFHDGGSFKSTSG